MWKLPWYSVIALLLAVAPAPVAAHETGVVRLSMKQLEAGGLLSLRGEKLPRSSQLRLELRGALATLPLGEVKTNNAGRFEINITVPETAEPGNYQLVVLAEDGDVTARAQLAILAAPPDVSAEAHAAMGHGAGTAPEATDELMPLDVKYSAPELAVIAGLVLAWLAGGFTLLRLRRSGLDPGRGRDTAR
jgi:hypothetical protein